MVRLPLPMVMVGVFVALAAKVMLVLPPPGILAFTEAISLELELESSGEREMFDFAGPLVAKMFPLLGETKYQLSRSDNSLELEEVRMSLMPLVVEEPLNTQRVWLVLSWLGKMSRYNCA